jgi:hypothetical protein
MGERVGDGRRSFISLVEIERDESDEIHGGWVTFDCIAEDSIRDFRSSHELSRRVLEPQDAYLMLRVPFNKMASHYQSVQDMNVGWLRIMVDIRLNQDSLRAEIVMFGDSPEAPPVGISEIEVLGKRLAEQLDNIATLTNEPRAQAGFISGVLDIPLRKVNPETLAVAIYDVGQGNCNAVVDKNEHPRIYFDLGWAPNFHAKSRPKQQPNFFACERRATPPVVLSHWDMDHWCYAIKSSSFNAGSLTTRHEWKPEALRRFWIARAPRKNGHKLGPLTMAFYRALAGTYLLPGLSAVLLWPESVKRIPFSAGWLEACHPSVGELDDRNNNGIAMFVRPNSKTPAILLTGDASFPSIPSVSGSRKTPLAGMVAPHHGARVSGLKVPKPKKGTLARLVMSVGEHNSYGHPKQDAIDAYNNSGWQSSRTQDRFDCGCGGGSLSHRHGNTLLKFSDEPDPQCGCRCVPDGSLCLLPSATIPMKPLAGAKKKTKTEVLVSA